MSDDFRYMLPNGNIFWYTESTPEEFLEDMISKVDSQIHHIKRQNEIIQQQVAYMQSKGIYAEYQDTATSAARAADTRRR